MSHHHTHLCHIIIHTYVTSSYTYVTSSYAFCVVALGVHTHFFSFFPLSLCPCEWSLHWVWERKREGERERERSGYLLCAFCVVVLIVLCQLSLESRMFSFDFFRNFNMSSFVFSQQHSLQHMSLIASSLVTHLVLRGAGGRGVGGSECGWVDVTLCLCVYMSVRVRGSTKVSFSV